jgi:hypothetical protein
MGSRFGLGNPNRYSNRTLIFSQNQMVRVLVPVKRVIDYAVKIRVAGGKVETANVKASHGLHLDRTLPVLQI